MAARGQALGALLLLSILATPCAFGLNPALDVSQYAHTAWHARDGFTRGQIQSIAQTSDGYLWLGTAFGLYRFDGIKAVPWQPPKDQPLPSSNIFRLAAAHDDTLWIGTGNGLASWKDGRLTEYPELAGLYISAILEDQAGVIWVGAHDNSDGKFCEIRRGDVRCHPEMSHLGQRVTSLHDDGKGALWVGLDTGVWQWKPGPPRFFPVPVQLTGITGMADDDDGALLISIRGAVGRLVEGKSQVAYPFPMAMRKDRTNLILRDRAGGLWVTTVVRGLVHFHQGRTEVFSQAEGLTGDAAGAIFEDREGSIWVATTNGLDRFRELPVVSYSTNQGWPIGIAGAVLAARDGSIWFNTVNGLNRLSGGQLAVYRVRHAPTDARAREIVVPGFQESGAAALFEDSRGRIWASSSSGVGYLENDRFVSAPLPGGYIDTISEDSSGNIWTTNQNLGLIEWSPGSRVEQIPWTTFGSKDPAPALVADPVHGGVWLGFFKGGIVYFRDGQIRAKYSVADGLGTGRVNSLRWDGEGGLWAATDGGLSRLKDGHIVTLSSGNGLPCDAVHWAIEDDAGSMWLGMPCGLVRVARADFNAWAADPGKAGGTIRATVLDTSDGVRNRAAANPQGPLVAKSSDGKLWFPGLEGISVVDPRHLPFNKLAPPVHIEQITADRKTYAAGTKLRLPPLVRDVQIDYTALSLVAPEKMRFRYKLEGRDRDWIDAGNRRQAFYSDLPPRNYRFRVAASNNSGVWNEAGAFLDFGVAPVYYQTRWFQASCAAAVLLLLAVLYQLRLRYLARQFHIRMEERVNERTRMARDLHDTLLQSFQGVLLKFQAVTYLFPDRVEEAPKTLSAAIEEARAAIIEGRDAVYGLRASTVITNDLAKALFALGEELAAGRQGQPCPECRVQVEGDSRNLLPLVRDEVYRIGGEAVRNAFRHAQATRIEVDIHYDRRVLRLRVRDDGKGIDSEILSEGGRAGHFGLPGMHERAKLVGGQLAVWSEVDSGTEVELTIPASVAYTKPPERRTLFARRHVG
jgi:signal transduction histidine kinase/ligand-binding sensor domain-containing protein